MNRYAGPRSRLLGLYAIGGSLGAVWLLPIIAFPLSYFSATLGNLFFFSPQYVFGFRWLAKGGPFTPELLFEPLAGVLFGWIFWGAIAFAYMLVARRWHVCVALLVAPVVIVVATIAVHYAFSTAGYELLLDGP
jgi:hypothetical protein